MVIMSKVIYLYYIDIGISGGHQLENASLAAQICKTWLNTMSGKKDTPLLHENKETIQGELSPAASNGCGYSSKGHFDNGNCSENNIIKEKMECGIGVAEPFVLPPSFLKGIRIIIDTKESVHDTI